MGITDLMRRAHEGQAAAIREMEKAINERLQTVGLPPMASSDFRNGRPATMRGWDLYQSLLEREGKLTPDEKTTIKRGRESVSIDEEVAVRRARNGATDDPFERWNTIVSLGLDSDPHYLGEREKARRAAEYRLIWQRTEAIRERVKAGESLPDPMLPDGEPITPDFALVGQGALIEWQAISELGFANDPHYSPRREAAMEAMGDVSRRRGDFKKILESYRRQDVTSAPESHQLGVPNGFVETEVSIPIAAFANPGPEIGVVRYHPRLGLIHGRVVEESHYDRGAGGYPGSRGARVKDFRLSVSLLLEEVNFRRCRVLRKHSVWRVVGDPPLIVGRSKPIASTFNELSYFQRFDTKDAAESFLRGTTESSFVRGTLPVDFAFVGDACRLRFFARPATE